MTGALAADLESRPTGCCRGAPERGAAGFADLGEDDLSAGFRCASLEDY